MPDVTFTGEGRHDPERVTFRGVVFPLGVPVTVTEDVAKKLRANSHFVVTDTPAAPAAAAKDNSDGNETRSGNPGAPKARSGGQRANGERR
ncbi:hypothetical protein [Cupriavidus oxalaticus]|uniref:hypothetical protein n=1 Tax=Cupriavidus oxalaticus TaxID=96344 RepID=UPI003F739C1F